MKHSKQIQAFLFLLLMTGALLKAQNDTTFLLFPAFEDATVKMKNGQTEKTKLNYNTILEEMIFNKNGNVNSLGNIDQIDTVIIGQRIFVPFDKVFYELLVDGPATLYVEHKSKAVAGNNMAGYAGGSETGASSNYSSLATADHTYKLKLPDNYHIMNMTVYWLKWGNEYYKANNGSQVRKIFPEHSKEIQQYIKKNDLNPRKEDDLITLIKKCNELIR